MDLYHSSAYRAQELSPGFKHSGILTKWDKTESNRFIYACASRDDSIEQGFASVVEKLANVRRVSTSKGKVTIYLYDNKIPTQAELERRNIYLYTITKTDEDKWTAVGNKTNGMADEYKTKSTIKKNIKRTEIISVKAFLKGREIKFVPKKTGDN